MLVAKWILGVGAALAMLQGKAFGAGEAVDPAKAAALFAPSAAQAQMVPYRTFVTIQNYVMDNNGDPKNPISNVRLEVLFSKDKKIELPEGGQYWAIGNGQKQPINRTFEVPWQAIANDGFGFTIQMVRKGSTMLPCKFDVSLLSQYNRTYVCHTDANWQHEQKVADDKLDKEGVEIRIFTDRNTPTKELPKDALALR